VTLWKWVVLVGAVKLALLAWLLRRWRSRATPDKITINPVTDNWLMEQRRQK
jgi:hypothetical protein